MRKTLKVLAALLVVAGALFYFFGANAEESMKVDAGKEIHLLQAMLSDQFEVHRLVCPDDTDLLAELKTGEQQLAAATKTYLEALNSSWPLKLYKLRQAKQAALAGQGIAIDVSLKIGQKPVKPATTGTE
jgi:hypothetical protein